MPPKSQDLQVLRQCQGCLIILREMPTCSGCRRAHYCSPECQRKDWQSHKKQCKANAATFARIKEDSKAINDDNTTQQQVDIRRLEGDIKKWIQTQRPLLSWAAAQALQLRTKPGNASSFCLYLCLEPRTSTNPSHRFSVDKIDVFSLEMARTLLDKKPTTRGGLDFALERAQEFSSAVKNSVVPLIIIQSGPISHITPVGFQVPEEFIEDGNWEAKFQQKVLGL